MGLFNIFDSIGRDVEREIGGEVENFARLDETTQRNILHDVINLHKEGLHENKISEFLRNKYNIDLSPDFIRRIKADIGLPEIAGDTKGLLKKIAIGAGIAGAGIGLGYFSLHKKGSYQSQEQPYSTLVGGGGGAESAPPSSPHPSSQLFSSQLLGGGGANQGFLGLPFWVWILIVIIITAIIGYILYTHRKKTGRTGGTK